jgi:hypothetical protein
VLTRAQPIKGKVWADAQFDTSAPVPLLTSNIHATMDSAMKLAFFFEGKPNIHLTFVNRKKEISCILHNFTSSDKIWMRLFVVLVVTYHSRVPFMSVTAGLGIGYVVSS